MLPFLRLPKVFHTVKGIKFPFELSQCKNADFKNQISHCLPWDYLRKTTDPLRTVISQIPFRIFIMTYHCCSLMCVWKIRESLHRNRPLIKIFQNRIFSTISPQLPPAFSPRVLYKTLAETCPQPSFLNRGSSVPHTSNLSFNQGSCKCPSFSTALASGISKDWATHLQSQTRQPHSRATYIPLHVAPDSQDSLSCTELINQTFQRPGPVVNCPCWHLDLTNICSMKINSLRCITWRITVCPESLSAFSTIW